MADWLYVQTIWLSLLYARTLDDAEELLKLYPFMEDILRDMAVFLPYAITQDLFIIFFAIFSLNTLPFFVVHTVYALQKLRAFKKNLSKKSDE